MANQHNKVELHFADAVPLFNNPTTNVILTLAIFNIIKPTLPTNKDDVDKLIKILKEKLYRRDTTLKTAGIYAIKSKATEKGDSIDNQIKLCQNYLANMGIESFKVYKDNGFSGKNTDRPAFKQLMNDCSNGTLDYIICYVLDRISRNISDFSSLISTLEKKNISFISVVEQFDTGSAMGKVGIIGSPTWLKVQNLLKANAKKAPARGCSHTALLNGLVSCAICGNPMRVAYGQKIAGSDRKRFYYMCTMKHNSGGTRCSNKNINGIELDDMVVSKLKESSIDKILLSNTLENYRSSLSLSDNQIILNKIDITIKNNELAISNLINNISLTTGY